MIETADIELGRDAFRAQDWREAYERLSASNREARLDGPGLELLANAAYLIARDKEANELWTRAHNVLIGSGEIGRAARVGFLLSLTTLLKGEASISGGWLARTQRLLETAPGRHVEEGFCWIVVGLRELNGGQCHGALQTFDRALALATESQDPDLLALSLLSRGQALIALGRSKEGVACLDEAMVSVTGGTVAPIFSGIIYCAVILTCHDIFDSRRACEWTNAFNSWCELQPDLVPFRGKCLVHRSEILQMRGDWPGALKEAERACRWLEGKSEATIGLAHYQKGELHRLMGAFDLADRDFHEAIRHGVDAQPGRALLQLKSGHKQAAAVSMRAACGSRIGPSEFVGNPDRLKLLGPSVEIFLAVGETDTAAAAAEELAAGARTFQMPLLEATSTAATGAIMAVTERLEDALITLQASLADWQELDMPYEMACTRAKLADVCHRLGDHELARMHGDAAYVTFLDLGATPDLAMMERMPWHVRNASGEGLTRRQMEVLRLLADGKSNREIATGLRISEHTVARHISNIFDKTGVSSRTAAVAFAHKNRLLE